MRSLSLLAGVSLTALAFTAHAEDTPKSAVKFYGTVNKAMMVHDDGTDTNVSFVDNNLESTRVGVSAEAPVTNGLTASALFEVEQRSNPSNLITQNATGGAPLSGGTAGPGTTPHFDERIARVGLAGNFGGIFLGQQDLASDDAFYHDLAAANSVMSPGFAAFGGGLVFRDSNGAAVVSGGSAFTPGAESQFQDGTLTANDSIRYNTPLLATPLGSFNGSLSAAQGGNIDLNARYNSGVDDKSVLAALGLTVDGAVDYTFINNSPAAANNEATGQIQGSLSAKHVSGIGATVAVSNIKLSDKAAGVDNPFGVYGKLGYTWAAYGVAVDYANFNDGVAIANDQKLQSYGLGGEYDMGSGVVLGALYRKFTLDVDNTASAEDLDIFALNMRVKF